MDKTAFVALEMDKVNYEFWKHFLDTAEQKTIAPFDNGVMVGLAVKNFSMLDHQFIQLKITDSKGNERQVWIPRNFVRAIVEGKSDISSAFSFAGKTSK